MTLNHIDTDRSFFDVIVRALIVLVLTIIPVYIHFRIFEKYFSQKRYGIYVILLISIIVIFVFFKNLIFVPLNKCEIQIEGNVIFITTYLFITTSLKIGKAGYEQRLVLQKIKAQHLKTELELLKSQINPHFLFNTLNNLFGRVRKLDENVAGGIAQLSHLMRYMIYESNVERINLIKEVEQINRLIELQKLRFSEEDDIAIDFKIEGDMTKVRIPPMLLIPFIENAFKHGILLDKTSFIKIHLKIKNKILQFSVRNSVHTQNQEIEDINNGLGLLNVRRRLELLFPGIHEFELNDSGKEFEIKLTLNLDEKKQYEMHYH